jgi:hypothetical protein
VDWPRQKCFVRLLAPEGIVDDGRCRLARRLRGGSGDYLIRQPVSLALEGVVGRADHELGLDGGSQYSSNGAVAVRPLEGKDLGGLGNAGAADGALKAGGRGPRTGSVGLAGAGSPVLIVRGDGAAVSHKSISWERMPQL